MSLRIRRGTDAQRQTITLDQGEIAFTTDTKKIYVGDGVTLGGNNILATSGGVGVTFNATTQALDFNTGALALTTSAVTEGANKYFTVQRAQDAAASLFTSSGSPTVSGTITNTVATGTVVLGSTPSVMVQGERFVVTGNAFATGNLINGTYYVVSQNGANVVLASTFALAQAGTAITTLTTATLTGVTYTASGTDSGITFTYDSVNHTIIATASGSNATSLVTDLAPQLGANLALNSYAISGNGSIGITGNITNTGNINNTGTITSNGVANLGGLTTTGTVSAGIITASGAITGQTLVATQGLGASLSLNSYNITGTGTINIAGSIKGSSLITGTITAATTGITLTANNTTPLSITGIGDGTYNNTVFISVRVAKGTIASPTTTAANDVLGGYNILGYNGSTYKAAGFLGATWDSTAVLTDVYPASIVTLQGSGGGSIQNKATLDAAGRWNAPRLKVTGYATGSYPTSPTKGEIIFDSTTNHFYGYNGTSWVAFTGP
jgi:hypothetical protein